MTLIFAADGQISVKAWGNEHSWNMNVDIKPEPRADQQYDGFKEMNVVGLEDNDRMARLTRINIDLQKISAADLENLFVMALKEDG